MKRHVSLNGLPFSCINKKARRLISFIVSHHPILDLRKERERVNFLLIRVSSWKRCDYGFDIVPGFSHGEKFVLAFYPAYEYILKKFSRFSCPRGIPAINICIYCVRLWLNVSWCKCLMIMNGWKTDNHN